MNSRKATEAILSKPVLQFKNAIEIFSWGLILSIFVGALSTIFGAWLIGPYILGHFILSYFIGRGRLSMRHAFGRNWLDVYVVLTIPWIGPIRWLSRWNKQRDRL